MVLRLAGGVVVSSMAQHLNCGSPPGHLHDESCLRHERQYYDVENTGRLWSERTQGIARDWTQDMAAGRHRAGPPTQAIRPYDGQVISTSQYHKALCPVRHWSKLDLFALALTCVVVGMLGGCLLFLTVLGVGSGG